ncbi:MAG: NifB/NifX family molybdenum-iron cluster-binding protein [Deltaproteobacteria bacterium]|nr:NifB/NifX family molybdenum-iron cluster-binding protein [Deltaproteobacteria bacterium]
MKIAIASKGKTISSRVDDRFGRCPYFLIVDTTSMTTETIENPGQTEKNAAGIRACQMLIDEGVNAVVVKNIGHNALVTLTGAGMDVYTVASGTVSAVVEKVKRGELTAVERPTVGFQEGLDN